jgi:hypothetical protein
MLFDKTSQWKLALDIGAVKTIARSIARAFAFINFPFHIYRKGSLTAPLGAGIFLSTENTSKQLGRLRKPLPNGMSRRASSLALSRSNVCWREFQNVSVL